MRTNVVNAYRIIPQNFTSPVQRMCTRTLLVRPQSRNWFIVN